MLNIDASATSSIDYELVEFVSTPIGINTLEYTPSTNSVFIKQFNDFF